MNPILQDIPATLWKRRFNELADRLETMRPRGNVERGEQLVLTEIAEYLADAERREASS